MGSLMAGWDSPTSHPEDVTYRRNKSLTKEEIEAYWKTKKLSEEEHLRAILITPSETNLDHEENKIELAGSLQRSSSLPSNNTRTGFVDVEELETNLEKLRKMGWWRRSNWAFLNEPPVTEGSTNRYVSQFHVANMATSKLGRGGVGA